MHDVCMRTDPVCKDTHDQSLARTQNMKRVTASSLVASSVLGLIVVNWSLGAKPTAVRPMPAPLAGAPACCAQAPVADGGVATRQTINSEGGGRVLAAAVAEAKKRSAGSAIAVVDDGGNLIALQRLDGTFAAGATVSIGKARTSALFKKPTKVFEDAIKDGRVALTAVSEMTPLQGGVPIVFDGQIVGAIGVSGAHSQVEDEQIAMAGAAAIGGMPAGAGVSMASPVTEFQHGAVADAFSRGEVLLDAPRLAVHASRRDSAGQAEVHDNETDVFYVLDGSATFVTGGSMVDPKVVSPGQSRAAAISGGETRMIAKGDVIVVPAGVPHWFQTVNGPVTYFAVKVKGEYATAP